MNHFAASCCEIECHKMYASVGRRWIVYEYFGILSEKRYGLKHPMKWSYIPCSTRVEILQTVLLSVKKKAVGEAIGTETSSSLRVGVGQLSTEGDIHYLLFCFVNCN